MGKRREKEEEKKRKREEKREEEKKRRREKRRSSHSLFPSTPEFKTSKSIRFYLFVNVGSLLAVTVVVWIQDAVSWSVGFAVPAAAMLCAIVVFVAGAGRYKPRHAGRVPMARVVKVLAAAARNARRQRREAKRADAEERASLRRRRVGNGNSASASAAALLLLLLLPLLLPCLRPLLQDASYRSAGGGRPRGAPPRMGTASAGSSGGYDGPGELAPRDPDPQLFFFRCCSAAAAASPARLLENASPFLLPVAELRRDAAGHYHRKQRDRERRREAAAPRRFFFFFLFFNRPRLRAAAAAGAGLRGLHRAAGRGGPHGAPHAARCSGPPPSTGRSTRRWGRSSSSRGSSWTAGSFSLRTPPNSSRASLVQELAVPVSLRPQLGRPFEVPAASLALFNTVAIIALVPLYDRGLLPLLQASAAGGGRRCCRG